MYNFVESGEIKPYKSFCTKTLEKVRDILNEKYEITTQFYLIGSGAKNLVTQNGKEPFDLDYNLLIVSAPQEYFNDVKLLKNTVINILNKVLNGSFFSDVQDSTSVITSKLRFINKQVGFSFDIGILSINNNGDYVRLIHEKNRMGYTSQDGFYWNVCPSSRNMKSIADCLKKNNLWEEVRNRYLEKKNMYLTRNDYTHPSFIIYVETLNEIYTKHGGK